VRTVDTMDTKEARQRLEAIVIELDRSVVTLRPEPPDADNHGTPGDADAGLDLADNARATALLEVAQEQLKHVLEALRRIDDGSYGRCIDCGNALPADRLEAKPEAARCMACQAKAEGSR
jgi:DnaK suppressor protein